MERNETIDIMKGIGICLVIFGHVITYGTTLSKYVFSFHIPLFFFISGYLGRNKSSLQATYYVKYLCHYIILYYLFVTIGLLRLVFNADVFKDSIRVGLYRTIIHYHSFINGPTWFLVTLPLAVILIHFMQRQLKHGFIVFLMILVFVSLEIQRLPYDVLRLKSPFNITNIPLCAFFVGCGWLYAGRFEIKRKELSYYWHLIGLLCLLLPLILSKFDYIGMMNCSVSHVGNILNIFVALIGIYGIYYLSSLLSDKK